MQDMRCSKRIFVLDEKHEPRYIFAQDKEATAQAIVRQRIDDGYWYEPDDHQFLNKLISSPKCKEPHYQFLLSRRDCEYEGFQEVYLEVLTDQDEPND